MASAKPQGQSYTIYICGPSKSSFTEVWTEDENNAHQNGTSTAIRVASDFDGSVCDIVDKTYNRDENLVLSGTERPPQLSLDYQHNSVVVFLFLVDQREYAQAEGTTTLTNITMQDDSYFEALLALHRSQYPYRRTPACGIWVYNSLAVGEAKLLGSLIERFQGIAEPRGGDPIVTFFSNNERDNWNPTETVRRLAMHIKDFHIAIAKT